MTIDYAHARELMVEQQIRPWDVLDIKVLDVLARLPREAFVADAHRALAYADVELPIGHGQKMMKPVIVMRLVSTACNSISSTVPSSSRNSSVTRKCFSRFCGWAAVHFDSSNLRGLMRFTAGVRASVLQPPDH